MKWKRIGADVHADGVLGEWSCRTLSSGQGQLLLETDAHPLLPLRVGLFGSPAEARLAAACYEAIHATGRDSLAANATASGEDWTGQVRSGTGTLRLRVEHPGEGRATGSVQLTYVPGRGVRRSPVAVVEFGGRFDTGIAPEIHVAVAQAVAGARLAARGSHRHPLRDGEELAAVDALDGLVAAPAARP
jgi:hypothetical protein